MANSETVEHVFNCGHLILSHAHSQLSAQSTQALMKRFVDLMISLPIASERVVHDDVNAPSADYVMTRVGLPVLLSREVSEESMSKDL